MLAKAVLATIVLALSTLVSAEDKTGYGGVIETKDGGLEGSFEVVDSTTLKLTGFTLVDGSAPKLYWWGSESDDLGSGFRISEEQIQGEHDNEDKTIKLDSGKTTDDFGYVGLWCEQFNANFGQAKLEKDGASAASSSSSSDSSSNSKSGDDKKNSGPRTGLGMMGALVAAGVIAGFMA